MRILGDPDEEFEPRNEIEELICAELKRITSKDISSFWTREEYRRYYSDSNDNPIDPGYDYVAKASLKNGDYYFSGTTHGINYEDGKITIEDMGGWRV